MTRQVRYVLATTFWSRCRGLLGRRASWLGPGGELVLFKCRAVHTFGMSRAIDVAFADSGGTVLKVVRGLEPGRRARCAGAAMAVERFAPTGGLRDGDAWYEVGSTLPFGAYAGQRHATRWGTFR